jgi:hypothetical protein
MSSFPFLLMIALVNDPVPNQNSKKKIPKDWYLELAQLETEKNRILSNMTYLSIDADEIEESLKKNFQNSFVKFFKQGR